jgi:hypothetical protein
MRALIGFASGSHWETVVAAICNVRAHMPRLGKPLWATGKPFGSHFCNYLSSARLSASLWEAIGKPFLLLFVMFDIICIASGSYWETMFAAICGMVFALICIASGSHWATNFAAICRIRAHLHCLGKLLGSNFYCDLQGSQSFALPREAIGKPCLLLFVMFAVICIALGSHWGIIGEPLLLLFGMLALICVALGSQWEAIFAAIYGMRRIWRNYGGYMQESEKNIKEYGAMWRNVKDCENIRGYGGIREEYSMNKNEYWGNMEKHTE